MLALQEAGAGTVNTYPRNLEGIVRKKDDRRRTAREARAERKAAEAGAQEEEIKRVKAHKRRELQTRSEVHGMSTCHTKDALALVDGLASLVPKMAFVIQLMVSRPYKLL